MNALEFAERHGAQWDELERGLGALEAGARWRPRLWSKSARLPAAPPLRALRVAALYRAACEQLALAQARSYPVAMTSRLTDLTWRAHQLIYRRQDFGLAGLRRLLLVDIPQSVRRHAAYVLVACAFFLLPTLFVGWASWRDPAFAMHVLGADQLEQFRAMYSDGDGSIGRMRDADTDWGMFGFYIMNNIQIAFQCFAGGIFAGLGTIFYLVYNGVFSGAAAGYVAHAGFAHNFFAFVVTHSAFELTAICLSGAAGLRMGHAVLSPGRRLRRDALRHAAGEAVTVMYAVFLMLVVAAFLEAFWSSARWVAPWVKYLAGACTWSFVLAWLLWQGRPRAQAGSGP